MHHLRSFILLITLLTFSGCAAPTKLLVRRDLEKHGKKFKFEEAQDHIVWFLIDGVNTTVFRKLLEKGGLPNIYRHVYRRGIFTWAAMASHPPSTYPNVAAQLTAKFPGHIGVPNNHYLDIEHEDRLNLVEYPGVLKARELLKHEQTIFQYLRSQNLYSVSVTDLVSTSANIQVIDLFKTGLREINRQWRDIDRKTFADLTDVLKETAKTDQLPTLMFAHLIGPDSVGHIEGVGSPAYVESLKFLDKEFGKFVTLLDQLDYYHNVAFVISVDHGQLPIKNKFDFDKFFYELIHEKPSGYCVTHHCDIDDGKMNDVVVLHGAERDAFIYLGVKDYQSFYRKRWSERKSFEELVHYSLPSGAKANLIQALTNEKAVGLVFLRESDSQFHVFSRAGHGIIKRRLVNERPFYTYLVVSGDDPLGLHLTRMPASEEYFSSRAWLKMTEHSDYPDSVAQFPELFQTPKTGDIVVYAAPGYSFATENLSGHGGGTRPEMYTPFLFGGDGIPHLDLGPFRTIDITPTILHYLGFAVYPPTKIDGISAFEPSL